MKQCLISYNTIQYVQWFPHIKVEKVEIFHRVISTLYEQLYVINMIIYKYRPYSMSIRCRWGSLGVRWVSLHTGLRSLLNPLSECWKGRSNCSGHSCLFGSVAVPAFDEAGFRNMKLLPYKYVYDVQMSVALEVLQYSVCKEYICIMYHDQCTVLTLHMLHVKGTVQRDGSVRN